MVAAMAARRAGRRARRHGPSRSRVTPRWLRSWRRCRKALRMLLAKHRGLLPSRLRCDRSCLREGSQMVPCCGCRPSPRLPAITACFLRWRKLSNMPRATTRRRSRRCMTPSCSRGWRRAWRMTRRWRPCASPSSVRGAWLACTRTRWRRRWPLSACWMCWVRGGWMPGSLPDRGDPRDGERTRRRASGPSRRCQAPRRSSGDDAAQNTAGYPKLSL